MSHRIVTSLAFLVVATSLSSLAAGQQATLRLDEHRSRPIGAQPQVASSGAARVLVTGAVCADDARAWYGEAVPGGGTLYTVSFANPATLGAPDRIAFMANVNGSTRNQGVFVADASGLHPIAMGSGGGGGSGNPGAAVGDPSPIGGRFTGFFGGTVFAPGFNAAGDVLFVADVNGGSAIRGLFLYQAATQAIVKVAAVGDPSPAGGTLMAIGPGSINSTGVVAFVAWGASSSDHQLLQWQNGVVTKIARVGDAAPGGGTYTNLVGESFGFVDGTSIPIGPVPDVNDVGDIAFRPLAGASRGVVHKSGAISQWYVKTGDPTPAGGTYFDIWGPILNNAGQVAFYADVALGGGQYTGGWFVGKPGTWRKALAFYDAFAGGQINGQAVSRNPMSPLSDDGDLVAWVNVNSAGVEREWLVLSRADGTLETVRGKGDPTSLGGTVGSIDAWPSINAAGQATLDCGTPGAPGIFNAYFLLSLCPLVDSYCTAGTTVDGCVPSISGLGVPSASAPSGFTIDVDEVPGQKNGLVFYGVNGRAASPWAPASSSFLCVTPPTQRTPLQDSGGTAGVCDGVLALDFNEFRDANPGALGQPMYAGQVVDAQGWFRDPGAPRNTNLSDALEFGLAP